MQAPALLLAALVLPLGVDAQTTGTPPTAASVQAAATARQGANSVRATTNKGSARNGVLPPDPDLFDGSKLEAEKRPEYGMIGDFEMPGSDTPDNSQAGGQQGSPGGPQNQAPNPAAMAGGAGGAQQQQGGGGAQQAAAAGGGGGGEQSIANNDAAGAVGGSTDQSQDGAQGAGGAAGGKSGSAGGKGGSGPAGKAEGIQAAGLSGPQNAASQNSIPPGSKSAVNQIGSAELRIDTTDVDSKDVVGRETTPGGTQGSNKAMPAGKGGQGSNNQNMGVEKGRVIPKGL